MSGFVRFAGSALPSLTYSFTQCLRRYLLLVVLFTAIGTQYSQAQTFATADEVPNPKNAGTGYISDAAGVLDAAQTDSLNTLLTALDQRSGVEAAIVIVDDFDANDNDFDFALKLFRKWGIGKSKADNGLLLFIATGRRQYRFITGYGLEGLLPDADLKTIGKQTLRPAFRQQNYGQGIITAFNIIDRYLKQPANKKELNTLLQKQTSEPASVPASFYWLAGIFSLAVAGGWQISRFKSTVPGNGSIATNLYVDVSAWVGLSLIILIVLFAVIILFFGNIGAAFTGFVEAFPYLLGIGVVFYFFFAHLNALSRLRKHYKDDFNFMDAVKSFYKRTWWQVLLSPLTLIFMLVEWWRFKQAQVRLVPPRGGSGEAMTRINRDENKDSNQYLSEGQLKEEQLRSQVYDIWVGAGAEPPKIVKHPGYNFDQFTPCPQCSFRTLSKPIKIPLQKATYTRQGKAKKVCRCRNCDHEQFIAEVTLPMLVESSRSSSSSGSGSSRSSSSSSSSGSWGGGRTGGGGAGGSW